MTAPKKQAHGLLGLLIDYGPVLVFFLVYRHFALLADKAHRGVGPTEAMFHLITGQAGQAAIQSRLDAGAVFVMNGVEKLLIADGTAAAGQAENSMGLVREP